jgi:AraC-like DNA-binding protein
VKRHGNGVGMAEIPLVRVRYADSFAQVLNQIGAPTERLLNQVNLSEQMFSVRDGYMTVDRLWEFTALATRYSGMPDIGLAAGLTPLERHSRFGRNLLLAPTLYQAITRFRAEAREELTNADFRIFRQAGRVWFCGGSVEGAEDEVRQVELYRIAMMVQVIRWAAGSCWKPSDLRLQSPDARHLRDTELVRDTNIQVGCAQSAVGFRPKLLSQSLKPAIEAPENGGDKADLFPKFGCAINFQRSVKEIVRTHILASRVSIKDVSRSLSMTVRTLQRHLAESGLTFSQLVDETRVEAAVTMLEESDMAISEIAAALDYSEPSHFTRAFRRATGTIPRLYRKEHKDAPD